MTMVQWRRDDIQRVRMMPPRTPICVHCGAPVRLADTEDDACGACAANYLDDVQHSTPVSLTRIGINELKETS